MTAAEFACLADRLVSCLCATRGPRAAAYAADWGRLAAHYPGLYRAWRDRHLTVDLT